MLTLLIAVYLTGVVNLTVATLDPKPPQPAWVDFTSSLVVGLTWPLLTPIRLINWLWGGQP